MQLEFCVIVDFFKNKQTRWQKRRLSFVAVAMACRTKWASNNQLRSVVAGTAAGRYQSCFLTCPVDSWECGATDTVPAAQTINGTHSSGKSPSLVLAGGACHILTPFPNLFDPLVRLPPPLFYLLYGLGLMGKGRRSQRMLHPSGPPGGAFIFFPLF